MNARLCGVGQSNVRAASQYGRDRGTALGFCLGGLVPVHNGHPGRAPQWIAAITTKLAHGLNVADDSYSEVSAAPRRKESSSQLSSAC
jgi:hypothetical protein